MTKINSELKILKEIEAEFFRKKLLLERLILRKKRLKEKRRKKLWTITMKEKK